MPFQFTCQQCGTAFTRAHRKPQFFCSIPCKNAAQRRYAPGERPDRTEYFQAYRDSHREQRRDYYAANKATINAKSKAFYQAHKDRIKAAVKRYRDTNRDKAIAVCKRWYEANKERAAMNGKARYQLNKEAIRAQNLAWKKANPERWRRIYSQAEHRRRARKAGAHTEPVDFGAIIDRDRSLCGICGKHVSHREMSMDHILPIYYGGAHAEWNLQVAHKRCNSKKGPGRIPSQLRMPFHLPSM